VGTGMDSVTTIFLLDPSARKAKTLAAYEDFSQSDRLWKGIGIGDLDILVIAWGVSYVI
jgi:hypothetical protein